MLSKGLKHATAPKVNVVDIAAPIEGALQLSSAPDQAKEIARIKICEAIRRAKKPSSNFNAEERQTFRQIKGDKDIQVLHADEGNATVLMNAVDYDAKVHDLLDDAESYDLLKSDPTRATERNLLSSLRSMRNGNKISEALFNRGTAI